MSILRKGEGAMISNQILQSNIEGLKEITRIDLCVCLLYTSTGRRSSVNLRGSSMPDGGADDGEEPEGVTDHGSKFGYYDGIYHEPAGIRVIGKGNDLSLIHIEMCIRDSTYSGKIG